MIKSPLRRWIRSIAPCSLVLSLTLPAASVEAAAYSWAAAGSGEWLDPARWTPVGGPPAAGDTATFNLAGSYDVRIPGQSGPGITTNSVTISNGQVTLRPLLNTNYGELSLRGAGVGLGVSGNSILNLGVNTRRVDVNVSNLVNLTQGTINVRFGSTLSANQLWVAASASSNNGQLTVSDTSGLGSHLEVTGNGNHVIGQSGGTGELTINEGGTANIAGSLLVGRSAVSGSQGTFNVFNGGQATVNNLLVGGGSAPLTAGMVQLTGAGSELTILNDLQIGGTSGSSYSDLLEIASDTQLTTGTGTTTIGNQGFLSVAGGLTVAGELVIGAGGTLTSSPSSGVPVPVVLPGTIVRVEDFASFTSSNTSVPSALLRATSGGLVDISGANVNFAIPGGSFGGAAIGINGNITEDSQFTIRDGAQISTSSLFVGSVSGGTDPEQMITRTVNLQNGALVDVNRLQLFQSSIPDTRPIVINIDSSTLRLSGTTNVVLGSPFSTTSPTIVNVNNGTFWNTNEAPNSGILEVNADGRIEFTGTSGFVSFREIIVRGGSIIAPQGTRGVAVLWPTFDATSLQRYHVLQGGEVALRGDVMALDRTELLVDGPDSRFSFIDADATFAKGAIYMVRFAGSAPTSITARNQGEIRIEQLVLGRDGFNDDKVTVNIESGGLISVGNLGVGTFVQEDKETGTIDLTPFISEAELRIDGAGSRLVVEPGKWAGQVHVGTADPLNTGFFEAQITLTNRGELDTRSGTIFINPDANITVAGGHLNLGDYVYNGGQVSFESGRVSIGVDLPVGVNTLLGPTLLLNDQRDLTVDDVLTITPDGLLRLEGGSLTAGSVAIQPGGQFEFATGLLKLTGTTPVDIGGTGPLAASTLILDATRIVEIVHTANVLSGTVVDIRNGGRLDAGTLNNFGFITMDGPSAGIETGIATFNNSGRLSGTGIISGPFVNLQSGEVRGEAGQTLTFNTPEAVNHGDIRLFDGYVDFSGNLNNSSTGRILGRGVLSAASLVNSGQIQLSAGFSDIVTSINNQSGSKVIVSGGAIASFYDAFEVQSSAELRVSAGASAVFFDQVQLRDGALVTGTGQIFYEGSLSIGNSPARQVFSTNTAFGHASNVIVEFGGPNALIPEFDQFVFENDLTIGGGRLSLHLISPDGVQPVFDPILGQQFLLMEVAGALNGRFGTVDGVLLSPQKALAITYDDQEVRATVALPGDLNLDGFVDDADLTILQANLGKSNAIWAEGDVTGNGRVTLYDAFLLFNHYNPQTATTEQGGSPSTIPEPASLFVMIIGSTIWTRRRTS